MTPGLLLAHAGLSALCFAMAHRSGCMTRWLPNGRLLTALRALGGGLVLVSFAICVVRARGSGVVAWFGWISISGLLVTVLLPYAPRLTAVSAIAAAVSAVALIGMNGY